VKVEHEETRLDSAALFDVILTDLQL
jgi:hypothetical protein